MLDLGGSSSINAQTEGARRGPEEKASVSATTAPVQEVHPSQMYAVDDSGNYVYDQYMQQQYAQQQYAHGAEVGRVVQVEEVPSSLTLPEMVRQGEETGQLNMDAVLDKALEEERARARARAAHTRRGPPGAGEVQVMEMSMQDIRKTKNPLNDTSTLTGLAFGEEHQKKMMAAAGAKPSMVHKQKHQIGSLYYDAKVKEMQIMEGRLQGVSQKAMAKQKYGW